MRVNLDMIIITVLMITRAASIVGTIPVVVQLPKGGFLAIAVGSESTFRLSISFGPENRTMELATPSLDPQRTLASAEKVHWKGMDGLKTKFGALLANNNGDWVLYDASNKIVVSSFGGPTQKNGMVIVPVNASRGSGQPCLSNGGFGPPFHWDDTKGFFVFSVSEMLYDPNKIHCFPGGFDKSASVKNDTCSNPMTGQDITGGQRSPNAPSGLKNMTQKSCCTACNKDDQCSTWIWADPEHPDTSGMNCWLMSTVKGTRSRAGRVFGDGSVKTAAAWWTKGSSADFYLAPAKSGYDFTKAYYQLTGPPAMPPRYGMAFMATYWGYKTMEEVENYMYEFRHGEYPIDSFIMDYDWWRCDNDIGTKLGNDFGYCPKMFGQHSFVHPGIATVNTSNPVELFHHFHDNLNMRFGGIRKPRTYSNIKLSNTSHWLLPKSSSVGAGDNNWNFSVPAFRDWYVKNHLHFLNDGMDFWWNDEGETQWFTYQWWNELQAAQYTTARPGKRHFTINRAFTPGMQRYPAVSWTGDGQDCSHKKTLLWSMQGQPYTCCDMTSPDATVLLRQYQNAVFLPIMRVHQMHGTPRFPFLWGGPEHHAAFRSALQLRYHFLPHLYSLAHDGRRHLRPIARPASFEFPADIKAANSYMVGDSILPADVSTSRGKDPNENTTTVYFPGTADDIWFRFNSTFAVTGGWIEKRQNVPLGDLVVYIRAGGILTLQRDIIQYSDQIGGVLEVHIYAGRNGAFDLVEDDGESFDYKEETTGTRTTSFAWNDASKQLKWTVTGKYAKAKNSYLTIDAILFTPNATKSIHASQKSIGQGGIITF